jgi:hypothetical protein
MLTIGLVFFTKVKPLFMRVTVLWKANLIVNLIVNYCFSILNKYIYVKGEQDLVRTPSLYLTPSKSAPHVRFSLNENSNAGIDSVGNGLLLNRWYHLAYTLSETKKRLDFYIDGELAGIYIIQPTEQIVFNIAPLCIGNDTFYNGTTGQIRYILL